MKDLTRPWALGLSLELLDRWFKVMLDYRLGLLQASLSKMVSLFSLAFEVLNTKCWDIYKLCKQHWQANVDHLRVQCCVMDQMLSHSDRRLGFPFFPQHTSDFVLRRCFNVQANGSAFFDQIGKVGCACK